MIWEKVFATFEHFIPNSIYATASATLGLIFALLAFVLIDYFFINDWELFDELKNKNTAVAIFAGLVFLGFQMTVAWSMRY